MKGAILALDIGTARIGLAVSDEQGRMALPLETVKTSGAKNGVERIAELAGDYRVVEIVVGWPLDMSGREGRAVDRVRAVVEALRDELDQRGLQGIPIERWDERLTTTAADRLLIDLDVSRRRRKQAIDQVAACKILEGYLGARRRRYEE